MTGEIYGLELETTDEAVTAGMSGEVDSSNAAAVHTRLLEHARGHACCWI